MVQKIAGKCYATIVEYCNPDIGKINIIYIKNNYESKLLLMILMFVSLYILVSHCLAQPWNQVILRAAIKHTSPNTACLKIIALVCVYYIDIILKKTFLAILKTIVNANQILNHIASMLKSLIARSILS